MHGYAYSLVGEGTLTAATTQTLLAYKPATNNPISVNRASFSCDGSAALAGIKVQLCRFTTDGTTAGSAPTPVPKDPAQRAALGTVLWKLTAEGSLGAVLDPQYVQTLGGIYVAQWQLDEEWKVLEGGNRIGVRAVTASGVASNYVVALDFRE